MGSETASILHRERDKDMGYFMDRCDGVRGDAVGLELAVFNLFGRIASDGRGVFEDGVAVDFSHHRIHHQMAALRKEIKNHNVPGSRRVRGPEAPSFCNHRHVWYPYNLEDRDAHSHQAGMHHVVHSPIRATHNMPFHGFVGAGRKSTLGVVSTG